ncbi:unnamed protein product [Blepharisma stoltei]|uniref:Uncharacterized protein n=1 Tax=Blepharisma stoltei TaxID=1481888 RepID=A0AAU9JQH0_9CILI|nr:unnamed protein product [Blepharisma stoltei]
MKTWIFLISGVFAYSAETKQDGYVLGLATMFTICALWFLMFILAYLYQDHKGVHGGFTQLVTYLQLARYIPLLDFSTSEFYKEFWKQFTYLYQGYIYYGKKHPKPEQPNFDFMRIETSLILYNAQEWLFIFVLLCIAFLFLPLFWASFKKAMGQYTILSWYFTAASLDFTIYGYLNLQNIENSSSAFGIACDCLSFIIGIFYFVSLYLMLIAIYKNKDNKNFYNFFNEELNENSKLSRLYYPLFIMSRIIFGLIFVFLYEHPYVQCYLMLGIEAFIVTYIIVFTPYFCKRNNIFTIIYHISEIFLLLIPIIYDNKYWDSATGMNNLAIWIGWGGALSMIIRFSLDLLYVPKDNKIMNEADISASDKTGQVLTIEPFSFSNTNDVSNTNPPKKKHKKKISRKSSYKIQPVPTPIDNIDDPPPIIVKNASVSSQSFKTKNPSNNDSFEYVESMRPLYTPNSVITEQLDSSNTNTKPKRLSILRPLFSRSKSVSINNFTVKSR